MSKLQIGVIGAGWFASRRHLPELRSLPDAEIAALCRRNPEKLAQMAAHFGVKRTYTDYRQMLEEMELDGVLIATPHALHYEQAKAALERGIPVLVEKPMTVTVAQGRELVALAEERGLPLLVALNPPYWRHCHALRERIQSGAVGEIEAADLRWTSNVEGVFGRVALPDSLPGLVSPTLFRADPALSGGGHLMDSGSHQVCELLWVTERRAVEVMALMDDLPVDLRYTLSVRLDNGALCTLNSLGDSHCPVRRVHNVYYGSKGTLTVDGMPFRLTWQEPEGEPATRAEEDLPPVPGPVTNFVDVLRGRAEPLCRGQDGLAVVALIEAAYESARTGKGVEVVEV